MRNNPAGYSLRVVYFSRVSAGFDGLLNWYGDRDSVVMKDIEEAFLAHAGWNSYLPVPYFVKAGDRLTELFRTVRCLV